MAAGARRTIKTVTGAGGQGRDIYDQAIDPSRSPLDSARLIAERAEKAQIDFLFTADLLQGAPLGTWSRRPLARRTTAWRSPLRRTATPGLRSPWR